MRKMRKKEETKKEKGENMGNEVDRKAGRSVEAAT